MLPVETARESAVRRLAASTFPNSLRYATRDRPGGRGELPISREARQERAQSIPVADTEREERQPNISE